MVFAATLGAVTLAPGGQPSHGIIRCGAPLAEPIRFDLGTVGASSPVLPASCGFDQAKGSKIYSSAGAGDASKACLGLAEGAPDGKAAAMLSSIGFVAAPVAALIGAVSAGNSRLDSNQLAQCESGLTQAMRGIAEQQHLRDFVLTAANENAHQHLVAMEANGDTPVRTVLETSVEELKLERRGSGDTSFALRIKSRARLVRAASGEVLYDQLFEYRSQEALFVDWALDGGRPFRLCTETGYRKLAETIVNQVFATSAEGPVLAGAGLKKSTPRNREAQVTLVAKRGRSANVGRSDFAIRPVSNLGTIGVYPKSAADFLAIQVPKTKDEAVAEAISDTEWSLDGMQYHPSPFVHLPAIVVAIPQSLVRQTIAGVRGLTQKERDVAETQIAAVARQLRFDEDLAMQLVAQLTPRSQDAVVLVKHSRSGYGARPVTQGELANCDVPCDPRRVQMAGDFAPRRGVDTALEIELLSASLKGGDGVRPALSLCVAARATLIRVSDGQKIHSCPVQYKSAPRSFLAWADRDAQLLRNELEICRREISNGIVDQLVSRRFIAPEPAARESIARN